MSLLAARMSVIRPSIPMAVFKQMQDLQDQGVEIANLAMGEPDLATPPHVIEAAHHAALTGDTRYGPSLGAPALRQAIGEKIRRENDLDFPGDGIMVTNGAKQAIFNAMMATIDPGDEVIIPAPYYMTYPEIVRLCGGVPVSPMCQADAGFRLTPEVLEQALTPKSKWLILNMPANPSGAVYSPEDLAALGEVLRKHPGLMVLSDEIYEQIVFDGRAFTSFAKACGDLQDRVLTVNGVSKTYGMTGWRVGYCAGPPELIKAMETLQGQSVLSVCSVAQAAAAAALTGPQDFIAPQCAKYEHRRDYVVERVQAIENLTLVPPRGAFYAYLGCSDLVGKTTPDNKVLQDDRMIVQHFLEQGVASVPGVAFGMSPYLRISFATPDAVLETAFDRLSATCAVLS